VPVVFSCFNWIFVPRKPFDCSEESVIRHEKMHARLGHT
jgi:hypothetical protein